MYKVDKGGDTRGWSRMVETEQAAHQMVDTEVSRLQTLGWYIVRRSANEVSLADGLGNGVDLAWMPY